jgi:thioredoxin-like negative regulator of GroEL
MIKFAKTTSIFIVILSSFLSWSSLAFMMQKSILIRTIQRPLQVVVDINSAEEFDSLINQSISTSPIIVDYQKQNCRACAKAAPLFEALSNKYSEQARFYKVTVEGFKGALGLMKTNGVRSVPTFQVWKAGQKIETIQGAHLDELENILQRPGLFE